MMAVYSDVLGGLIEDQGIKAPVAVATTADMTNSMTGLPVLDGYQTQINDRILVRANTDATTNGIYAANTGAWARTIDFSNSGGIAAGTLVYVFNGTTYGTATFACQNNNIVFGSTNIEFLIAIPKGG